MNIIMHPGISQSIRWRYLFFFCFGLFIASLMVMKWIETEMIFQGEKVSIFGLELFYTKQRIETIFGGIDASVRQSIGYHLYFDFIFMAGCFPGIASLCMIAAEKVEGKKIRSILFLFAALQIVAWVLDIIENIHLIKWLKYSVIRDDLFLFHAIVYSKWLIAVTGVLVGLIVLLVHRKKQMPKAAL